MGRAKESVRDRILRSASELLAAGGREAVSTRAVCAAAGVQAPAIYRQFGDMRGLLDAVVRETLAGFVREKAARAPSDDPVEDLRDGWDRHVDFALANPAAYVHIYGDPTAAADVPAARDGEAHLEALLARAAEAGRLRVSVPHAARMFVAAGRGVALTLVATPPEARDPRLSESVREAVIAAVTGTAGKGVATKTRRAAARAVALRAVLDEAPDALSEAERRLLGEWLDRLAAAKG